MSPRSRRLLALGILVLARGRAFADFRSTGSSPLLVRLGLQDPPRPAAARPGGPRHGIATAEEMARGLPYRAHSVEAPDYYDYHVHGLLLAVAGLLGLAAALVLGGGSRPGARVAAGLVTALVFLGAVELNSAEIVPSRGPFVFDARTLWRLRANIQRGPNTFHHTDAEGYRWLPEVPPGGQEVLVLGDSTSYGTGVEQEDSLYAWRLQDLLGEHFKKPPRVLDRAIPGFTSWQGLLTLRQELRRRRPRVVIAGFMANDWTGGTVEDRVAAPGGLAGDLRAALHRSHLYLLLRKALLASRRPGREEAAEPASVTRVPVEQYVRNLEEMARLCREHGADLLVVALPMAPALDQVSAPYRDALQRLEGLPGVQVLDLHAEARARPEGQDWFWEDDPLHPDDLGHAWIASRLLPPVLEALGRGPGG